MLQQLPFNSAVTPHAVELGYTHVNLGMAAAIAGAIGRTASPIAGVTICLCRPCDGKPSRNGKTYRTRYDTCCFILSIIYVVKIVKN